MKKLIVLSLFLVSLVGFSQIVDPGKYRIKNVNINTKFSDFGTAFFGKEKVVFASPSDRTMITKTTWEGNDQQFLDLYLADIVEENGELANKKSVSGKVNNKFHQGLVAFTKDQKTVYFDANNYNKYNKAIKDSTGTVNIQLYKADVLENGEWDNVVKLSFNSDHFSTGHPTLNADDTKLYFISDRPGSIGKTDIFVVDLLEDGTCSSPRNMGPKINTIEREMFPFISEKNFLYFSSDGHRGSYGELDVYASRIFDNTVSESINLEEPINSVSDDFAYIINDENNKGYFSSNREGGNGDDDIYSFTADPPIRIDGKQAISGIVKDVDTDIIIPGATITLLEGEKIVAEEVIPTELGEWDPFIKEDPVLPSKIAIAKGAPSNVKISKHVDNESPELGDEVVFTVRIENLGRKPVKGIEVNEILPEGYVYVKDSDPSLFSSDGNKINVPSLLKKQVINIRVTAKVLPNEKGAFSFTAKSDTEYKVQIKAPGFLTEEIEVKTENDTDIPPLEVAVKMDPELRVENEKIMVNINTIYFDYDKWNIREDAAKELDKVVEVMKEHPSMVIEAGSHTDSRATEAYNQILSEKRAQSTVDYIVSKGIDKSRIVAKGYGEMQPVNKCKSFVDCTEVEHQLNRRTEFVIVNDEKQFASNNADVNTVNVDKDAKLKSSDATSNISIGVNNTKSNDYVEKPLNNKQIVKNIGNFIQFSPLYYEYDSWSLSNDELQHLDKISEVMNENPKLVVEAQVHTDSKNSEKHNQLLSDKRAKSVKNYIVSKGIAENRILAKGFGEMRLVNKCKSFVKCKEEDQQANRRIEFIVISGNGYPKNKIITKKSNKFINTNPIYFDYDKYNIRKDAAYELDRVVKILKENSSMVIEAGSHTDSNNTEAYNQKLSERRANSVKEYLMSKGIKSSRIISKGYGEMQLVNKCSSFVKCTAEQHQENRRTEFKILKN